LIRRNAVIRSRRSLDIRVSYAHAKRAINYFAWEEPYGLRGYEEEQDFPPSERAAEFERQAINAFHVGNMALGAQCFEAAFSCYRASHTEIEHVKEICLRILTAVAHQPKGRLWQERLDAGRQYIGDLFRMDELFEWMKARIARLTGAAKLATGKACPSIILKAQNYIADHYGEDLTIQEIAKALFISPNYLGRIFREQTGYQLTDWINICRIDKAKELLSSTDIKTYEVASAVGFSSYKYFSLCFLKYAGFSAREYRKSL